jgi:hypothetical protein
MNMDAKRVDKIRKVMTSLRYGLWKRQTFNMRACGRSLTSLFVEARDDVKVRFSGALG